MRKRILSIVLTLCMLISVLPQVVFAEGEESTTTTAKDITLGYSALHDGDTTNAKWDYVYFGTYNNSPIKWRVLSTDGNNTTVGTGEDTATYKTVGGTDYTGKALFMLSENTLGSNTTFGYNNKYQGSALQTAMKGVFSSDSKELKYVLKTTKTDRSEEISYKNYIDGYGWYNYSISWATSELADDTLFALSARESEQYLGSGEKYANRKSGNAAWWFLRSPYSDDAGIAGVVYDGGGVGGTYVDNYYIAVRPALNLNLSSVLFTSAAVGGKSSNAAAGGVTGIFENKNYADITDPDGYKLTLLDESRSGFKASLESLSGNTATVSYNYAEPGTNEYISVIIKNGSTVKYYGRVASVASASGTVDITLPNDFSTANGDVLCVFNEQYNGDKNTDYASKLIDVLFDYTVNFDANGATGTMASQTMTYGATANLSANTFTKTGYTFTGWNTKADGKGTAYSDKQSVKNLVSDASTISVTLYAQWKLNEYGISYTLNGGTTTNPTTYTVESEDITLNNPAKSGYAFTGWSGTGLTGENNMTVTIPKGSTGNRSYVAHYSVKSGYTVSFDVNGGDTLADKTGVKWTDKILDVVPIPTRTGYTFKGWQYNNTDITADTTYAELAESDTVTSITLTAKWEENSNYTVSFDTADGTSVLAKTHVKWTDKVLDGISEPTRDGYEFTGWKCENAAVTADTTYAELAKSDTVMIVTLTAQWKDISAPTGEIKLGTNSWKQFLNNITFGLFFKDTQEVTIAATDNSGEDVTIEYLLSDKELTDTELLSATFTAYTGKFSVEPNNEYVIYAKLTDTTGNVAYINSNGIVLDNIAPVISGIENGKTYCSAQTVTVSDKYEVSVTVNGESVTITDGTFTLSPAKDEQKIVVTDKAGNTTEMTVIVNDGHTYEWQSENNQYWQKCMVCDHETAKKDIPEITINGADKVCVTQDYTFTFTLPEGVTDPKAAYYPAENEQFLSFTENNGVYSATVSHTEYSANSTVVNFFVKAFAKTADGFEFQVSKEVRFQQEHIGGIADCTHKAKCEVCGEEYGEVDGANHTDEKEWSTKNATQHEQTWKCCGAVEVALENHEWEDGVCEKCGYTCQHTGGTATCTDKATCEVCGEKYGEANADNHTTLKHTEAKAATTETEGNSEYWHCEECCKYFSDKDGKNEIKLADTVIAKLPKTDDNNKSPQTGDNSHMALWIALLFISGGALVGTTVYSKKKKRFVK